MLLPGVVRAGIAPVSGKPLGHVPADEDEPLGSEVLPALSLTALLLAAVGVWKLSRSLTPPSPVAVNHKGPSGASLSQSTSHRGAPQPCHEQGGCHMWGGGGEPAFWLH